jgi:GntR family transcriptional regulator
VPVIDKASAIPYYEQLAELLRREIGAQRASGEIYRLPSESELSERHGLSRATVRHALDQLEREGWIYRQKGVGSFAPVRRVEEEPTQLVSTTEALRHRGVDLVTRVIDCRQMPALPHVVENLRLRPAAPVYQLVRVRLVDEIPVSLQTAYLPAALCPKLEENDLSESLYRLLEARYGLRLWTGREVLRARGATPSEAGWLDVDEGTPVMYAERITYAADGSAVEYLEAVWRGDRFDFKVTMTRPAG